MSLGPVEMIVVGFPDANLHGAIAPALADLVDKGLVRIIDLVFVTKDENGDVAALELSGVPEAARAAFEPLIAEISGLVSDEDVEDLAESLEPGQAAGVLLFEHVWATAFADACVESGGELLMSMRIPRDVIDEALAAIA